MKPTGCDFAKCKGTVRILSERVNKLEMAIKLCKITASYSVGDVAALRRQLTRIRETVDTVVDS